VIYRKLIFFLLLIIGTLNCPAQNLVPNPSFEEYTTCPQGDTNAKVLKYWFQLSNKSTDYFNKCSSIRETIDAKQKNHIKSVSVPSNYRGFQYARTGKGYIGLAFYTKDPILNTGYGEYLTIKLKSQMIAGKRYKISYYVSLASSSQYGISNLSMSFCSDGCEIKENNWIPGGWGSLDSKKVPVLDTLKWIKVSWIYKANGWEQFIVIGSFIKNISCKTTDLKSNNKTGYAYYYVDDVCVAGINKDGTCDCGDEIKKDSTDEKQLVIQVDKNIALNNVFFNSDKSELLPTSFDELNELVNFLKKNTNKIEISGYTDNTGTPEKNLSLSQARAKAVVDYLISKGINANRVNYKGYGSASPVTTNDTEGGKAKNRRVEFRIINNK